MHSASCPLSRRAGRLGGTRSTLTVSLSAARATWANYTLDGITNTDVDFNTYILLPSVEAQEFKVQSDIYPVEFGREAGQVNISTKPADTASAVFWTSHLWHVFSRYYSELS